MSAGSQAPAVSTGFAIEILGEDVLLVRVHGADAMDAMHANRSVHALAAALQSQRPPWLRELVPAYATLALQVDADALACATGSDPLQAARAWLEAQARPGSPAAHAAAAEPVEIPVCYGGAHGPDLDTVAAHTGLPADEVVRRHVDADYRVAMLGFAPGFPYLLGLDPALAVPRLETPRTRVAAGSVGIGGAQTGIYPREGPGGWRLIGRTPLALFDAARDAPSLLQPGQPVRFVPIAADAFARLASSAARRRAR